MPVNVNQLKVEQNLRYKVLFSNKVNQSMNLLERMAYYNVQAVNISIHYMRVHSDSSLL